MPASAVAPESSPGASAGAPARAEFFPRVESLRGLGALAVAVFHSIHLLPVDGIEHVHLRTVFDVSGPQAIATRLLMVVFNGGAAVSLFFVMSGFVLQLSLARDRRAAPPLAAAFAVRRVFRIHPAMAVNLLAMFGLAWGLAFAWSDAFVARPPWSDLARNLLLTSTPINGATWSMAIELLAIPAVLAAHFAWRRFGTGGLAAFALYGLAALRRSKLLFGWKPFSLFVFMFWLGMLLPSGAARLSRLSSRRTYALLAAGASALLAARFLLGEGQRASLFFEGIGGAIVVALAAYAPPITPLAWLDAAPVRWLGRVSYSFYLHHPLVLMTVAAPLLPRLVSPAALDRAPLAVGLGLAIVTIPASLVLAALSHRFVERPGIALGRRIEDWLPRGARPDAGAAP